MLIQLSLEFDIIFLFVEKAEKFFRYFLFQTAKKQRKMYWLLEGCLFRSSFPWSTTEYQHIFYVPSVSLRDKPQERTLYWTASMTLTAWPQSCRRRWKAENIMILPSSPKAERVSNRRSKGWRPREILAVVRFQWGRMRWPEDMLPCAWGYRG